MKDALRTAAHRAAVTLDARMLFGFGVLAVLAILAVIIAIGKVHQESSYGLGIVLGSIAVLAGQFSQWAFSGRWEESKPATLPEGEHDD